METSNSKVSLNSKPFPINHQDTITSKIITLDDYTHFKGFVVAFICNHCPYVQHIDWHFADFARKNLSNSIGFLAINSNDSVAYPEDSPIEMKKRGTKLRYPFPYIYDDSQELAKQFKAMCTPEFFLYSNKTGLVYHGRYDDSTPGNSINVSGKDLQYAIDCLLTNKLPINNQKNSVGCSIKWK